MADYPYTTVPGKISKLFEKIQQTGVPPKVTQEWLRKVGFSSSNDRTLIPVLSFIGFVDSKKKPTERWRKYRGAGSKEVLAHGIREGYKELFSIYPDAYRQSKENLTAFFRENSNAGDRAIGLTVYTFQELCKLADFESTMVQSETTVRGRMERTPCVESEKISSSRHPEGLTININIQLTLPETRDEKIYDAFFSAMKKHLMEGGA